MKLCNKRGNQELEAHHIKPWALFKKDRYKIKNGITLCQKCHKFVHKEYRKQVTLRYPDYNAIYEKLSKMLE